MRPIFQYYMPQRFLSRLGGLLASSEIPWLKNRLINYFVNRYPVNMNEAQEPNPFAYPSFNAFFTRNLQPNVRPMAEGPSDFISPVDGRISQLGSITDGQLIQAKGHNYSVRALLGGDAELATVFEQCSFITLYLAPPDYHRIHMPIDGQLSQMIYVPGRLFSVNQQTAENVPNLFARNERVITIFKTAVGQVAVILIGAMIVGSIETTWAGTVAPSSHGLRRWTYADAVYLKRGEELGRFKLGSTVVVLLENHAIQWVAGLCPNDRVLLGEKLGLLKQS